MTDNKEERDKVQANEDPTEVFVDPSRTNQIEEEDGSNRWSWTNDNDNEIRPLSLAVPVVLSVLAFGCSTAALFDCRFLNIEEGSSDDGFGYITVEAGNPRDDKYSECKLWERDEIHDMWDSYLYLGRAMGIISVVGGFFLLFTLFLMCPFRSCSCLANTQPPYSRSIMILVFFPGLLSTFMCFTSGMMLIGLRTHLCDNYIHRHHSYRGTTCKIGPDLILMVAACMSYAGAAVSLLVQYHQHYYHPSLHSRQSFVRRKACTTGMLCILFCWLDITVIVLVLVGVFAVGNAVPATDQNLMDIGRLDKWDQVGPDLVERAPKAYCVAMSSDGMVVGVQASRAREKFRGSVKVFRRNRHGTAGWTQLGQTFREDREGQKDQKGGMNRCSLSMSSNGHVIAFLSTYLRGPISRSYYINTTYVDVYHWDENSFIWNHLGQTLRKVWNPQDDPIPFFRSVALSADGKNLGVLLSHTDCFGCLGGDVALYSLKQQQGDDGGGVREEWKQRSGSTIHLEGCNGFESEMEFSADGTTLAVLCDNRIRLFVRGGHGFQTDHQWITAGSISDQYGSKYEFRPHHGLSLSANGKILAVASQYGYARVYQRSSASGEGDPEWKILGSTIVYASVPESGISSLSLSADGHTLAAGVGGMDEVLVLEFMEGDWKLTGMIAASKDQSLTYGPQFYFGNSVALSSNGTVLAAASGWEDWGERLAGYASVHRRKW